MNRKAKIKADTLQRQRKRQLEDEEIERKCDEFRAAGKCRVKGDPPTVEFRNKEGKNQMARINFLPPYPKNILEDIIEVLKDPILIEEIMVRYQCTKILVNRD